MSNVQTIKEFVIAEFAPDVSADEISTDLDLLQAGIIDSLGLLKLIAWLEDRFQLSVEDTALDPDNFRSVEAIESFIDNAPKQRVEAG
ncbi:MAG TPA: acyl carrier protein [Acidimicrobiales bacterium]|jgi:acyl carrier protein